MTGFQDSVPKIERFDRWLKNAFVVAGLDEKFAYWPGGYKSNLSKHNIRKAIRVAAACGERHASRIFYDLVSAGSEVHIQLMAEIALHRRPVLECILHHCSAAPVRAVLERLDFFSKLSVIAPKDSPSLELEITHFPDLGSIALSAARKDWGVFSLALSISAIGQLDGVLQEWNGLKRLQNILAQEPMLRLAMGIVTPTQVDERATLCELILPSFRASLENSRRGGVPSIVVSSEILNQMCDLVRDGRVVVGLLGRLVEAYGLEGIKYYVKAPNPAWLVQADHYLEFLQVVPENLHSTALDLAASVSEPREVARLVGLFRQLGGVAVPVVRAVRSGHRFSSSDLAVVWKARELGAEGAAYLDKLPVSEWGLAVKPLHIWREGVVDLDAISKCCQADWHSVDGKTAVEIVQASRRELGIVRLGRLGDGDSVWGAVVDLLRRNLRNFYIPPREDEGDVLIVVASRSDHNFAFSNIRRTFEELSKNSHPVLIEGDTPEEIVARITEMRAHHAKAGWERPVSGIAFLGHGSSSSLQVSARSSFSLDSFEVLREIGMHLAPGADCYLGGCLVARRDNGQNSFADTVAKAMPHCRVSGCPTVRYSQTLSWDDKLGFVESWSNHSMVKIRPSEMSG